ncbi:antibiotic biosynthesis monooxygenase family protein [Rhodococcus artemisiae]|uniref:Stress-response A/B barrel domain-containing protein n=1 Tax=Rhodococcus artemisiae TaxID=714159 RepID=A0ABU7L946_9NOCA|nr:hypothetical protein [Rhodococcus artemisiae]MEE2058078.1 hypothetical protein [Rhodococcus artemisiae]
MPIGHVVTFTFTPDLSAEEVTALGESLDALSASVTGIESYWH